MEDDSLDLENSLGEIFGEAAEQSLAGVDGAGRSID